MNYNAMSDTEFMHYLDIYNDDPIVRRLIGVLERTRGALVDDLVDAGMDAQDWTFGDGWSRESPGQYIQELQRQIRGLEDDNDDLRKHKEELEDECNRLKSRSVLEFLQEVEREKIENQSLVREAMKTIKLYKDENEDLKQKIDMWGRLNLVKQGV
jgi:hypothetical protein